jgi:NADPH:quinone reductase-like Zn-dependent oxidoreductase
VKAVVIREHGSYDKLLLEEMPAPEPREGEVRVRIRAAALNHLDTWVRRGIEGFKFPLPIIPGCDGAGTTDAGEDVVLSPGLGHPLDKDYGILGETRDGTCAEFIVVPRENVLPKPARLSWEEAAAWPLTFLTAWAMLTRRAQVQAGEWVLVHAAGSGVGVACVQMAKMLGARGIGTASSEEKRRRVLGLGADAAIPYEDFARAARGIAGKAGVDVVVDHVGPATWEGSVSVLRRGGRLVTCGGTTGHEIKFDLRHLFFKSLSFLGSTMGTPEELRTVLGHVEAGRLKPVVDSVFRLDEIRKAHARLADRAVFGKVVVVP